MRTLFATDGSPGADKALRFLLSLPLSVADHVTVLCVPRYTFLATDDGDAAEAIPAESHLRQAAGRVAQEASALFAARAIPTGVLVGDGPVSRAIERAALERSEELVVIGSRGLGTIGGVILGSTGRALARRAPVSLLVVREFKDAPRRILAAVDGSAESDIAIDLLSRLPLPGDVEVTLLHVLAEGQSTAAGKDAADEALFRATRALRGRRVARSIVERGDPADRIVLRALSASSDLVVLGSHGQSDAHGILQTSVADTVLHRAHCAVLIAKPPLAPRSVTEALASPYAVLSLT